ncbi:DUF488 domain-containing protein [Parapedobacter lycopersici]|uniref:DUF488 domain-containing protein n=1 Tax=Parapedobacter lycopersici TaxID=1864939 RepID=UPI003341196B
MSYKKLPMANFQLKRIYEQPAKTDGYRILIDRLWPRGVKKEAAELDEWDKEIAPSAALRKQFDHRPERFDTFSAQYHEELLEKKTELDRLRELAKKKQVTLLYASKDEHINHAVVLKQVLES